MVRVGFIGLGVMGRPMAANLLRAGYTVSFFSRRPEATVELANLGGIAVRSSREAAEGNDVVISLETPQRSRAEAGDRPEATVGHLLAATRAQLAESRR